MNIDILASNPPWWFYILFAVATTLLTLAVWLIFKHNSDVSPNSLKTLSVINKIYSWRTV
jgi:hypothetical protein